MNNSLFMFVHGLKTGSQKGVAEGGGGGEGLRRADKS